MFTEINCYCPFYIFSWLVVGLLDELVGLHPELRRLSITGRVTNQDVRSLLPLADLESLQLNCSFTEELQFLNQLRMHRLRSLSILCSDPSQAPDPGNIEEFVKESRVESLELSNIRNWTDEHLRQLAAGMENLKRLSLQNTGGKGYLDISCTV